MTSVNTNEEIKTDVELGDTIALKLNTSPEYYISYNPDRKHYIKDKTKGENTHFIVGSSNDGYTTLYNKKHDCYLYVNKDLKVFCAKDAKIVKKTHFSIIRGNDETKIALKNRYKQSYLKFGEYDDRLGSAKYKKKNMPMSFNNELFIPEIISKRVEVENISDLQKKINKRIESGSITKDEAVCYMRRYPDIEKEVGGIFKVEEGQNHWKRIGRWKNLNPLCDGKEYTPTRYKKLQKKIKAYNKTIDKEEDRISSIASKSANLDDEYNTLTKKNSELNDLLYVDYPFEDDDEGEVIGEENIIEDNIEEEEMLDIENFENYNDGKQYMLYEGMGLYDKALELNENIEKSKRDYKANINKIRDLEKKKNDLNTEMKNNFLKLQETMNKSGNTNDNDTSDEFPEEEDIVENMTNRQRYEGYLKMKHQEILDIENQNKFLDNEIKKHVNSNMTYERKSEFKSDHKTLLTYINQQFLIYIYVCVALFAIYLIIFKISDIPRYLIVLFTLSIIIYPFYIYSFELGIYKIWNFIYSNFVGEPIH